MPQASMPANNPLFAWLEDIRFVINSDKPLRVSGLFGDFDVEYHIDPEEPDDPYALIGFMLPGDGEFYAEIDSGTYGTLMGIRIYLDVEPDEDERSTHA